ncbi:MAG: hypothetical protein VB144_11495 [Clostridia bacterium]|nr:hypothetical protein [Clostridia bacterium]
MADETRSLADEILDMDDIPSETVEVPEWGKRLLVRGLTGAQRAKLAKTTDEKGKVDVERIQPELIIYSVYDPETNQPVFKPTHRDRLNGKFGKALDRLTTAALRVSGLTGDDEAITKNS